MAAQFHRPRPSAAACLALAVCACAWLCCPDGASADDEITPPAPPPSEAAPAADPAASPPDTCEPLLGFKLEDLAWQKGKVKIVPFGTGIFNAAYNTSTLFPGSYALYAQPHDVFSDNQYKMSPQNSFLGLDITGPKVGDAQTAGRIDFDFRGPSPVENQASLYFFDIYGEIKSDRYRFVLGQTKDVIAPLDPPVVNFSVGPVGYGVGNLGFFRTQVRGEYYLPLSEALQLTFQGCLAQQIVPNLQPPTDIFGDDAGWPDLQGRVAVGLGPLKDGHRRVEAGISGHVGQRVLNQVSTELHRHYATWSLCADWYVELTERTGLEGEAFVGQLLGSYNGGINQGIDPVTLAVIRARGGWLAAWHRFNDRCRCNVGFGIDSVIDDDLSTDTRTFNAAYYANVFVDITTQLTWAVEVSWWDTHYVAEPTGRALRIETAVFYKF